MVEINKIAKNCFGFTLKSENGTAIFNSVVFNKKADIKNTLQKMKAITNKPHTIERKTNFDGKFLFSLKDTNGNMVGKSELYSSEAGMENGIKNLQNRISFLNDQNLL